MKGKRIIALSVLTVCLLLTVATPAFAASKRTTKITGVKTIYRTNTTAVVAGKLAYKKTGLRGATVKVYELYGKKWYYVGKLKTNKSGKFSVRLTPGGPLDGSKFRFKYAGSKKYKSKTVNCTVYSKGLNTELSQGGEITLSETATTAVVTGQLVVDYGNVTRASGVQSLTIAKFVSDTHDDPDYGNYTFVKTITTDAEGRYSVELPEGEYRFLFLGAKTWTASNGRQFNLWETNNMVNVYPYAVVTDPGDGGDSGVIEL